MKTPTYSGSADRGELPWSRTLTPGSGDESQFTSVPSDGDYTIKLLVNPVARNRPKCRERCLEGLILKIPRDCLKTDYIV